ncbi:hypothetical protein H109_03150 [Trichophyton interdigitale MR816]|uniref:Uncharacterized protein n=1 Tax=Trichophyton interdigitale (strain MR816) TaxID=1215338 RepID=A0A059JAW5_TRIIM|nr:hypothetical protein H101_02950 [Trichophyton interdigitale H6]KDB25026.1 hypothetical protein H109_03150 [Trichophyton interdigitale MR816]
MQRMHERRSATADGFDAGPKGTARRGRQTDGSPPPPLTPGNPEDRGREMLLSSLSCVSRQSHVSSSSAGPVGARSHHPLAAMGKGGPPCPCPDRLRTRNNGATAVSIVLCQYQQSVRRPGSVIGAF